MSFIKAFFGFLITFLIIDAIWIGFFARELYQTEIPHLLAAQPHLSVVVTFYLVYAIASTHLAIMQSTTLKQATLNGASLGLVAYGTYAATNYAMLAGWSAKLLIVDLLWGAFITAICSAAGFVSANIRKPHNGPPDK